jgi:acetate kinase
LIASGIAERLGAAEAFLKFSAKSSENICEQLPNADHRAALRRVIERLSTLAASEVDAIGHRIVHGGEYFQDTVLIDDEVLKRIEAFSDLAPLHNPPGAQGIRVVSELISK